MCQDVPSRQAPLRRTQGRALIAWARACRQRQLETFRQQEKVSGPGWPGSSESGKMKRNFAPFREARSFDFRQKFVEMMCWHGKASPCCHSGLGCGFVQLLQDCDDHLAFHIWQVPY